MRLSDVQSLAQISFNFRQPSFFLCKQSLEWTASGFHRFGRERPAEVADIEAGQEFFGLITALRHLRILSNSGLWKSLASHPSSGGNR